MLTKLDAKFDDIVADPIRRRDKIASLSWGRILLLLVATLLSVFFLIGVWKGKASSVDAFVATMFWIIAFQTFSDLRLLRAIERLQKDKDTKPTA